MLMRFIQLQATVTQPQVIATQSPVERAHRMRRAMSDEQRGGPRSAGGARSSNCSMAIIMAPTVAATRVVDRVGLSLHTTRPHLVTLRLKARMQSQANRWPLSRRSLFEAPASAECHHECRGQRRLEESVALCGICPRHTPDAARKGRASRLGGPLRGAARVALLAAGEVCAWGSIQWPHRQRFF